MLNFKKYNILRNNQFGFMFNRSNIQILSLLDTWTMLSSFI